ISRQTGIKTKDLEARLGSAKAFPSVAEIKADISQRMTATLENHKQQATETMRREAIPVMRDRADMTARYKQERQKLQTMQEERWQQEETVRSNRLHKGLRGIWQRITGTYQRMRQQNEEETKACLQRDRDQKQALIDLQLEERRTLQQRI